MNKSLNLSFYQASKEKQVLRMNYILAIHETI